MICAHENFRCDVVVNRVLDVKRFTADVRVRCADGDLPFEFIGLECGLSYEHPTCDPSAQELRCPIKPKGLEILPGIKGPAGFTVRKVH